MTASNGVTKVTIGTHNGSFHCDETLACSLLKLLPRYREAEIVRSRDPSVLSNCTVVVDVGGEYDPDKLRFDHHQKSFSHSFNSLDSQKKWTTKLSSAGLVYFHFGREIISLVLGTGSDKLTEKVFDKVYENFIQEIDAIDNGISTHDGEGRYNISTNLSSRVSHLSPNWNDEEQDFDVGFYKAVDLTKGEFLDRVNYYGKVWWAARDIVNDCIQDRFKVHKSGRVLEFAKGGVPWKEHLFELEAENNLSGDSSILYVLYTDQSGMWRIQCVPQRSGSFENRLSLPQDWRGLRDAELEKLSGISGATFVHSGGFIGGNRTREGVLEMTEAALKSLFRMDIKSLSELLKGTLDPTHRNEAEKKLTEVHKIIGFGPVLLQVIMSNDVELPVRQAAVIYLKNMVSGSWVNREAESPGAPIPFSVHEQDRALIRDNVIDAVVRSPDIIRIQLAVCVSQIVKHDFPGRWPQIVDKVSIYLQNPDPAGWLGSLLCLYQLVKNYEYKKSEERAPLKDAMNLLLPQLYSILTQLINDSSQDSVAVQKQILKIYFALTQYVLPLDLITKEIFSQWMEVLRVIAESDVPDHTLQVDEEERPGLIWWKRKKWALHTLTRLFERYGSPGSVTKEYKEFAEWYLKTFSGGILTSMLKNLDQFRRKVYVSPRVMQQALNYINTAISHAHSWKLIKPHMLQIIQDIVFPLMSYSESDADLWDADPYEYIRIKFDIFEDFVSPVTAAQTLLHSACKKRKEMLQKTMNLLLQIIQTNGTTPSQKDGALHMIGTMADILLKKPIYKEQMEKFLVEIVFPEFNSPHGHLRARACWVLHYFSDVKYQNEAVLAEAFRLTINSLLHDKEPPVKVEAAIAVQMMLSSKGDLAKKYLEPQIREITLELLKIIRETENDDLTTVMQKIVCTYTEQLVPVAVDICQHLVGTFAQVLESADAGDEKAITAMGLLNTMETILAVMEERPEVHAALEPVILQAIHHIFTNSIMEFYEEAMSLSCDLTSKRISPDMWKMLEVMYSVFQRDGFDYFSDMMPALHNYITVDTQTFLSSPDYMMAMFNMCKTMLEGDPGEDPECHAAKLLEVIIIQCKGMNIDQAIPIFVELVLKRLTKEVKTSELRTMCLQVIIAALYYNPSLLLEILDKIQIPGMAGGVFRHFIQQWIHDTDCFIGLHDRKLCVLGLVHLLQMPDNASVAEQSQQLLPSALLLFDGLKRAYAARDSEEDSEDGDSDEEGVDSELLDSDEDEIDDEGQAYLESLQEKVNKGAAGSGFKINATIEDEGDDDDDDDEEDYDGCEETSLEAYTTPLDDEDCPIDEYNVFKDVLCAIQASNPQWYAQLTSHLSENQGKALTEVITMANQRVAAKESKVIEQQGGYQFAQATVPGAFNFGAPTTSPFGK